jgi:hypothetical protein
MLELLIATKTRIKLLLKFFLNSNTSAYLRGLATTEFEELSNTVRLELNRLEDANMIIPEALGNKKEKHALYDAVNQIVRRYAGIDEIVNIIL